MTAAALWFLCLMHHLPLAMLRGVGGVLGGFLYLLAGERRRVADTNLRACFPDLGAAERGRLVRATFRAFARSLIDRSVLWYGSEDRIRKMVSIEGESSLAALEGQSVILLAPHFVGMDAGGTRLTLDRRMVSIYAAQKNAAFDRAVFAGRTRFNRPVLLSRQDGVRAAVRAMRDGLPFYYLPDMDFGSREAIFVPFFGVPAATLTTVARLARIAGARVVPCVTRMTAHGYVVTIEPPWPDFPSPDVEADTRRVNAFVENQVRSMPEQYHWLHKRFKTRPPGAPPLYARH